tara:strand:- start:888 stop:1169 length:282 start_codon:yes stop_codon:yes gene_type:complete
MADLHKAIRAIHDTAVTIDGDTKDDITALDSSGNEISINWSSVEAWSDPDAYIYQRMAEYPAWGAQLDNIYHNGIDDWKADIKKIKDKYPKPE